MFLYGPLYPCDTGVHIETTPKRPGAFRNGIHRVDDVVRAHGAFVARGHVDLEFSWLGTVKCCMLASKLDVNVMSSVDWGVRMR